MESRWTVMSELKCFVIRAKFVIRRVNTVFKPPSWPLEYRFILSNIRLPCMATASQLHPVYYPTNTRWRAKITSVIAINVGAIHDVISQRHQQLVIEVIPTQKCHTNRGPITLRYKLMVTWKLKYEQANMYLHNTLIAWFMVSVRTGHAQPRYASCKSVETHLDHPSKIKFTEFNRLQLSGYFTHTQF
jgi:hypothetical protein